MTTATYEVDHYQINCAVNAAGDASITLLVFKNPDTDKTTNKLGTIKSAVLIDGGNGEQMAAKIEKVVVEIERTYDYESNKVDKEGKKRLLLDAVAVTHWDKVQHPCSHTARTNQAVPLSRITTGRFQLISTMLARH